MGSADSDAGSQLLLELLASESLRATEQRSLRSSGFAAKLGADDGRDI